MLLLTRTVGQKILIGDDIVITVTEIRGGKGIVRLGIDAPEEIGIVRPDANVTTKRTERK